VTAELPRVLDGDHGVVGQPLHARLVPVGERARRHVAHVDDPLDAAAE
jgi:hypothetical protein